MKQTLRKRKTLPWSHLLCKQNICEPIHLVHYRIEKTQLNGVISQILIYLDDNTGIFHVFEMQIEMNEFDHHIIFSAA